MSLDQAKTKTKTKVVDSDTIEDALTLVDKKADSYEAWKTKGLGLRLVLLGLAELQSRRLKRLAVTVYEIENELLGTERLRDLNSKQLFSLYQLTTKALSESSEFVERTLRNVQWDQMETELLQVEAQKATQQEDLAFSTEAAQELLTVLARLQAEKQ